MIRESRLIRDILLIVAAVMLVACSHAKVEAWPAVPGIYGTGGAPPPTTACLVPETSYDKCSQAHLDAQFINPLLITQNAMDVNGNPITVYHDPSDTFNPAGIAQPVGLYGIYKTAANRIDPRTVSVAGTFTISGTTLTTSAITNGGTPGDGMDVWDNPSGGGTFYPSPAHIVGACSGTSPNFICTLDHAPGNHSNFSGFASLWAPCVDTPGTSTTKDSMNCYFRNSSNGWTATIIGAEWGPINGHNATTISGSSAPDGTSYGKLIIANSHCLPDQYNNTSGCINITSAANPNISLEVDDTECDGGNDLDPLNGPFTNNGGGQCVKWASQGSLGNNVTVSLNRLYVHDWSANPINISTGYSDVTEQTIVLYRISMNCGNSGSNICHGAPSQFGTTAPGTTGSVTLNNITVVFPYGATLTTPYQTYGVTSPMAILGGIGSAIRETMSVQGATIICNSYIAPDTGIANCGGVVDPFRQGPSPSFTIQHVFANDIGVTDCGGSVGGDLQASGPATASETDNGDGTSTWNSSGWSSGNPLYYPGQAIVRGAGSSAITFMGTLTDNGDGTSHLHIDSTSVGTTTNLTNTGAIQPQIVAFYLADWQAHPTRIITGSNADYTVSNGSGSGEAHASQQFKVAQVIMPFGQGGTTATGGTSYAGYSGTVLLGGNNVSVPTPDNNWSVAAIMPGTLTQNDNWMMATSGSAGEWGPPNTPGGNPSYCPATGHA